MSVSLVAMLLAYYLFYFSMFSFFFQILNYCELSDCHNYWDDLTQIYFMKHFEHQLGICEQGPFKQISARTPPECSE